jgi:hypothetical protein
MKDGKKVKNVGIEDGLLKIVFSTIKRVLDKDLLSKIFKTQKVEAGLKVMLYNKLISSISRIVTI